MIGRPKYKKEERVSFEFKGKKKSGFVYIVDAYGTDFPNKEPSYDIMVEEERGKCLYKHISESQIL